MDLKEFIVQSISAIADATVELQEKYSKQDIVINPPSAQSGGDVFQPGSENYTMRRVQRVEFDVAVTIGDTVEGRAGASIKVWSMEIGGERAKSAQSESVSRVRFAVPMTLKPSAHETSNSHKKAQIVSKKVEIPPRTALGASRKV